jgi:hypothetical protein
VFEIALFGVSWVMLKIVIWMLARKISSSQVVKNLEGYSIVHIADKLARK